MVDKWYTWQAFSMNHCKFMGYDVPYYIILLSLTQDNFTCQSSILIKRTQVTY